MFDLSAFDISEFEASAGQAARLLRALANRRRLMILCQLADGERSVGDLQAVIGLSQSAMSQHLAMLRQGEVVSTRREGQTIRYRLADPAAAKVIMTLAEIYCPPSKKAQPADLRAAAG